MVSSCYYWLGMAALLLPACSCQPPSYNNAAETAEKAGSCCVQHWWSCAVLPLIAEQHKAPSFPGSTPLAPHQQLTASADWRRTPSDTLAVSQG